MDGQIDRSSVHLENDRFFRHKSFEDKCLETKTVKNEDNYREGESKIQLRKYLRSLCYE